jgi:hypothetical protein
MAQDELIRARADAEQAELRDILSATVREWAQRHRNDVRQVPCPSIQLYSKSLVSHQDMAFGLSVSATVLHC